MNNTIDAAAVQEKTRSVPVGIGVDRRPGYFGAGHTLFGVLHRGREQKDVGVVICPPLGYEGVQAYRSMGAMADALAHDGHPTLRVDYPGIGESLGDLRASGQVPRWCEAVDEGIRLLKEGCGVSDIVLLGVRGGALIAYAHAARARSIVLWEPPASGAAFVREMEILAAATAGMRGGAEPADSGEGGEQALLLAGGYPFNADTLDGLRELGFLNPNLEPAAPVLLVQRDDRRASPAPGRALAKAGHEVEAVALPGFPEMMRPPARSVVPDQVIGRVRDWVASHPSVSVATPEHPESLHSGHTTSGRIRRSVRYVDGRILGVLAEPVGRACYRRVLMLVGGAVPRTAVNRMYVDVSEALAESGCSVLRVDLPGVGESPAHPGLDLDRPFTPHLVDDVRMVVDELSREGPEPIGIIGLCSGAYPAFQMARFHERVDHVVLINPWLLTRSDYRANFAPGWTVRRAPTSNPGLKDVWLAFRRGDVSARFTLRALVRRGCDELTGSVPRLARIWSPWSDLSRDLRRVAARGAHVTFAFARGDAGEALLRQRAGPTVTRLVEEGAVSHHVFDASDHAFNALIARAELESAILAALGRPAPS